MGATQKNSGVIDRITRRPRGLFYGWWVVAVSAACQFLAGGLYGTGLAVYFLPISRDLGLNRTAMSLAFTLRSLETGIDGPLTGYLVDRLGPRIMVRVGGALTGLGFILLAFMHSYTGFLVVFLGVLALGASAGFSQPLMALLNQWFYRKRALAMNLGYVGAEVGGMVLTPLIALVVLYVGWREAAVLSGILLLGLVVPLSFFIRNSPESMGLVRDGGPASAESGAPRPQLRPEIEDFTVSEALRTRAYWHFSLAMGARLFGKSIFQVHLVPLMVWKGLDEQTAALLVGLLAFSQVPLRIAAGWLGDRWSMTRVPALAALAGVATVALLLLGRQGSVWTGVLFVVLFALAESANTVSWAITGHFFGRKNFATLRGGVELTQSLLSVPGPVLAGWFYDRDSSYTRILLPIAGSYLLASALYWTLRRPGKLARRP